MKQKCEVIMLPQIGKRGWDKGNIIQFNRSTYVSKKLGTLEIADYSYNATLQEDSFIANHLYLVSDQKEKIPKSNYVYYKGNYSANNPYKSEGIMTKQQLGEYNMLLSDIFLKVVLASTDKSLGLPLIPESFIKL